MNIISLHQLKSDGFLGLDTVGLTAPPLQINTWRARRVSQSHERVFQNGRQKDLVSVRLQFLHFVLLPQQLMRYDIGVRCPRQSLVSSSHFNCKFFVSQSYVGCSSVSRRQPDKMVHKVGTGEALGDMYGSVERKSFQLR